MHFSIEFILLGCNQLHGAPEYLTGLQGRQGGWQQPRNDDTCQADTAAPPKRDAAVWQRNTWAGSYHVWDSGSVGRVAVMARPIGATAGRGGLTHADRNIANTLAHHCRFCAGGGVVRRAIR